MKGIFSWEQFSHATDHAAIQTIPASPARGNAHVGHAGLHQLQEQPEKRQGELFFSHYRFKLSQAQQRKADSDYLLITPVILKLIHFKPHQMGIYPTLGFPAGRFGGPWQRNDPHVTNEPHFKHGH